MGNSNIKFIASNSKMGNEMCTNDANKNTASQDEGVIANTHETPALRGPVENINAQYEESENREIYEREAENHEQVQNNNEDEVVQNYSASNLREENNHENANQADVDMPENSNNIVNNIHH